MRGAEAVHELRPGLRPRGPAPRRPLALARRVCAAARCGGKGTRTKRGGAA